MVSSIAEDCRRAGTLIDRKAILSLAFPQFWSQAGDDLGRSL